jgi:hypothetical protein
MENQQPKFRCDICQKNGEGHGLDYYGYNSTYGYCDKPECKKEAKRLLREDIHEAVGLGDLSLVEDLAGDGDLADLI